MNNSVIPSDDRNPPDLREVNSRDLMQGQKEIVIRHAGEAYRLSVTHRQADPQEIDTPVGGRTTRLAADRPDEGRSPEAKTFSPVRRRRPPARLP